VFSDDYYLTDLDLWMIFEGSKIPVVVLFDELQDDGDEYELDFF
jgi:hypothetical protein